MSERLCTKILTAVSSEYWNNFSLFNVSIVSKFRGCSEFILLECFKLNPPWPKALSSPGTTFGYSLFFRNHRSVHHRQGSHSYLRNPCAGGEAGGSGAVGESLALLDSLTMGLGHTRLPTKAEVVSWLSFKIWSHPQVSQHHFRSTSSPYRSLGRNLKLDPKSLSFSSRSWI